MKNFLKRYKNNRFKINVGIAMEVGNVILLEKDLNVIKDSIIEGQKTYHIIILYF